MRDLRPKAKQVRRFGSALSSSPKHRRILERRPHPPGQHGARRRAPAGAYGRRLLEKQKLKAHYGVAERQMRRYVASAARMHGLTGWNIVQLLELRLDALVYRLGFAPSIQSARQLVSHGHVLVNGSRIDIASYQLRAGETLAIAPGMRDGTQFERWREMGAVPPPPYLEVNRAELTGRLLHRPSRDEIPIDVDERLIVEFYAR